MPEQWYTREIKTQKTGGKDEVPTDEEEEDDDCDMDLTRANKILAEAEEPFRSQQLALCMLDRIIKIFGRHHKEQRPALIVDPFAGTGSTGIAAIRHGCDFIGIDKDEDAKYAYMSWKRRPAKDNKFGEQLNEGVGTEKEAAVKAGDEQPAEEEQDL